MGLWHTLTAPLRRSSNTAIAGYLPEPGQPSVQEPPAPSPPQTIRIEMVTKASVALDYGETLAGYRLTPERLFQFFRQADAGSPGMMLDAFESIVIGDGHTRGQYESRMDDVCLQDWHFFAPEEDERPFSIDVAKMLSDAMHQLDTPAAIEHLGTAVFHGAAYVEVPWQQRAKDGVVVPVDLVRPPHRRFRYDTDSFRPRIMHETNMYPGEPLVTTRGTSWIIAEPVRWRKPTQAGLFRSVAPWCVFKRMSVRDLILFGERFGIPMIIGKYGEESSESSRAALVKALEILGTEGRAVIDEKSIIEVTDAHVRGGKNEIHPTIVALCNAEISKIMSGGTLTSDAAGPGSYGLGTVHAAQKHKLSLADAGRITRAMDGLAREFVRRNGWWDKAAVPRLHIEVEQDQLIAAQTIKTLGEAGLDMSKRRQRRKFNQPPPRDTEDKLAPPAPNPSRGNQDEANQKSAAASAA